MTDLAGGVFYFSPEAEDVEPPVAGHPCVVVLAIAGSKEAVVVPCFTAGRRTVARAIAALERQGIDRGAISVELDNRTAVVWSANIDPGARAEWAAFESETVPLSSLRTAHRWGRLQPDAFAAVAACLVAWAESPAGRGRYSDHLLKKLRKLVPPS